MNNPTWPRLYWEDILDGAKLNIKANWYKQKILILILLLITKESCTMCFYHIHPPTIILPRSSNPHFYPLKFMPSFTFLFQDQFVLCNILHYI